MSAGMADLGVDLVKGHFASSVLSSAGAERSYSSRAPESALLWPFANCPLAWLTCAAIERPLAHYSSLAETAESSRYMDRLWPTLFFIVHLWLSIFPQLPRLPRTVPPQTCLSRPHSVAAYELKGPRMRRTRKLWRRKCFTFRCACRRGT